MPGGNRSAWGLRAAELLIKFRYSGLNASSPRSILPLALKRNEFAAKVILLLSLDGAAIRCNLKQSIPLRSKSANFVI